MSKAPPNAGVVVYRYWLGAPSDEDRCHIMREMRAAHDYRNELTAIAQAQRNAIRELEAENPELAAALADVARLKAEVADASAKIKSTRAKARKRSTSDADRAAVTALRIQFRDAKERLKALRLGSKDDMQARRDLISEQRSKRKGIANRAVVDAGWRTCGSTDRQIEQACKKPLYDEGEPNDPRFRRWSGEGQIGGQTDTDWSKQPTIETVATHHHIRADLYHPDERITLPVEDRYGPTDDGRRKRLSTFHMRIGTEKGDGFRWVSWPMRYHREIPPGSRITNATVNRRMKGPREVWSVQLTLALSTPRPASTCGTGVVAVDIGWKNAKSALRVRQNGRVMRLAYWAGDDGKVGELEIDDIPKGEGWDSAIDYLTKANDIRSKRDQAFDAARDALAAWLKGRELPEWLTKATETIDQWKSQRRLVKVARQWREARFDGDAEAYDAIEAWRYRDGHLWRYETGRRSHSLLHRRELCRLLGVELAKRYGTIIFADVDYAKLARKPLVESDGGNPNAAAARQMLAPSETRDSIAMTFKNRGGRVTFVNPAHMTTDCYLCGHRNERPEGSTSSICDGCGQSRDMDRNLAENMLRAHREGLSHFERSSTKRGKGGARGGGNDNGSAPVKLSRYDRIAAARQAKKERLEAARKVEPEAAE